MVKYRGESSKMGQAGPLPQAAASGLQVQTRSQAGPLPREPFESDKSRQTKGKKRDSSIVTVPTVTDPVDRGSQSQRKRHSTQDRTVERRAH
ncbi:hypothetical protein BHE74_00004249 [Ensete ventricosum]|nr:hypothetical protein BHE74_00004249 [Ensete ventricosum]